MRAVGITAEYNPFHHGHQAQIAAVRERFGADTPIAAVLSGDFVQRGEAAAFSKFARAEAAVRCGVSLILELPLPWSLSSAEGFARGAVGLLTATGVVDTISFGSESGDLDAILRCASALEDGAFSAALRKHLSAGVSFAAARERAAAELIGPEGAAPLRAPNDLLAVEYVRAAARLGVSPAFLPVKRTGSLHDGPGSASELRRRMGAGEEWLSLIPAAAAETYRRQLAAGRGPVTAESLRLPLLSRLRDRSEADFAAVPDAAEGIEHKLCRAARELDSPEAIAMAAKSKRYALSRLRRMLLCAALGVKKGMADALPPYIRVLAMDEKGAALLRAMRKTATLPVIVKPALIRHAGENARAVFELGSAAHDLYVLGFADRASQRGGEDPRTGPFRLGLTADPEK